MLDGDAAVVPQCLAGADDLAVRHQDGVDVVLACGAQGQGGGPAGAEGVDGDRVDGDVDRATGIQGGVQRPAVLRLDGDRADAVVPGGGGDAGEQTAPTDRDHHGVQTGDPGVDLLQQGAAPAAISAWS